MRVSGYQIFTATQNRLTNVQGETQKKLEQISTGKVYSKVSDDPVRVNKAMLIETSVSRVNQFVENANDAKSMLEYLDNTYAKTTDCLNEVKTIALKGANGTLNDTDRVALADAVDGLIDQVLGYANSKNLDRQIFSGQMTNTVPVTFDGTNFTYHGNDTSMKVNVSDTFTVDVTASADKVFIPVLEAMVEIRDALKSNDQDALTAAMDKFDTEMNSFIDTHSLVGNQLYSTGLMAEAYKQSQVDLSAMYSDTVDVDMAEAITDFTYLQTMYSATLKSTAMMMKVSILDYI